MEVFIAIVAVLCGIIGIIGSIAPALPGPPISWVGMLILYFWGGTNGAGETMSLSILLIWLAIVILVTILDYVVPAYFTKLTGGSKYASIGTTVGLIAGLFIPPVGMILGSLLGAFIAELIFAGKSAGFKGTVSLILNGQVSAWDDVLKEMQASAEQVLTGGWEEIFRGSIDSLREAFENEQKAA